MFCEYVKIQWMCWKYIGIMKKIWSISILLFSVTLESCYAADVIQSKWAPVPDLNGLLFETKKLAIDIVNDYMDCLLKCNMNTYCLSVVYNNGTRFCQEYSGVFFNAPLAVDIEGSEYYVMTKDSCRSDGYFPSNDGLFCYKVYPSEIYDHQEAESLCSSDGGRLLVVDTAEKQGYMASSNLSTAGWINSAYYIDGSDEDVETVWKFSTGVFMPMTSEFWGSGMPDNAANNEDCVIMTSDFGFYFKWNDVPCAVKKGVICERLLI